MTKNEEMLTFDKDLRFVKLPVMLNFLVLDDMESMQVAVARDIKGLGFKGSFYGAKTIAEAKEALSKYKVDFIFTELNLQDGESGLDFLKFVRGSNLHPKFPIVVFTTEDEISNTSYAVEAGASGYVVKPWDIEDLKEKIGHAYNELING